MVLDPNNPLSAIGRGNDPSLEERTTNSAAASDALRSNLAKLTSQGQNADRLAGVQGDIAATAAGLKPFYDANIVPNTPTSIEELKTRRLSDLAGTDAATRTNDSLTHLNLGNIGRRNIFRPNDTAIDSLSFKRPQETIVPLKEAASAVVGKGAAVVNAEQINAVKEEVFMIGDVRMEGFKRTTTKTDKISGKDKSPDAEAVAADIIARVNSKPEFGGRKISKVTKTGDGTARVIFSDGAAPNAIDVKF